ncbi:hypothetical protein D021_0295B, partial [Vibrio parahaemolyticus 10296]
PNGSRDVGTCFTRCVDCGRVLTTS